MTTMHHHTDKNITTRKSIKHIKTTLFGQVRSWPHVHVSYAYFFLLVLGLALGEVFFVSSALAFSNRPQEGAPPIGLIPRPTDKTSIALTAYTADVALDASDERVIITVTVRVRLHNQSTVKPASVTLDVRGKTNQDTPIENARFVEGITPEGARPLPGDTLSVSMQPDERKWLTFFYSEEYRNTPWIGFRYNISALTTWPTTIGSVRFTFHLPPNLSHAAFLHVSPDPSRFDTQRLEWQWEELTPQTPIRVLFIHPLIWQRITTLRQQSKQGDLRATKTLAQLFSDIIGKQGAPPEVISAFYPEAVALWTQVAEQVPDSPEPWRKLAALYALQADRGDTQDTYRNLILNALEEAWQRGDRSPYVRQHLAEVVRSQVDHLITQQRWEDALEQINDLRNLLGPSKEQEIKRLRQEMALAWVQNRLQAHDKAGIQAALVAGWGNAILSYFRPEHPSFAYLELRVRTDEHKRTIRVRATFDPQASPAPQARWDTWVKAIKAIAPEANIAHTQLDNTAALTLTIPYADATELLDVEKRIASTVPAMPEWAFLRDALSPSRLQYEREETLWGQRVHWVEEINMAPARQEMDESIATLRATAQSALPPDFPPELSRVREALRQDDIRAWEELRDTARATYITEWRKGLGPPLVRRWQLQMGDQALMQASRALLDPVRSGGILGLLILLWTGITLALWHTLGR